MLWCLWLKLMMVPPTHPYHFAVVVVVVDVVVVDVVVVVVVVVIYCVDS